MTRHIQQLLKNDEQKTNICH